MGFKEVAVSDTTYIRPSKLAEEGRTGLILEGEYMGSIMNELSKKNDYKFSTANGNVVINNTGSLQARMERVAPGTLVQVHYNGKATIEKGPLKGKEAHQFNVLVEDGE